MLSIKKVPLYFLVTLWSLFCLVLGLKLYKYSNVVVKYNVSQQVNLALIVGAIFLFSWIFLNKKNKATFNANFLSVILLTGILLAFSPLGTISVLGILFSAWAAGDLILEDGTWVKPMVLGLALFMAFLNFFVHTPWNFAGVYIFLLAIPILLRLRKPFKFNCSDDSSIFNHMLFAVFFIMLTPTLLNSLRPEIGFDAMAYQLLGPSRLAQYGAYDFDVRVNSLAVMPQGINWLYALAMVLGGELGVKLFVVILALLTAAFCIEFGATLGKKTEGLLAAIGLISFPVFEMSSGYTFVENGILLFTVASGLFGYLAISQENKKYLLTSVFLVLANLACKQNGLLWAGTFGLGLLYYILVLKKNDAPLVKQFFLVSLLGVVVFILPVYGFAYWKTGNPFFPFFNGIFKSPFYEPVSFNNTLFNHPYRWNLFYDMTKYSNKYLESDNGSAGVILLFSLPLTLFWFFKKRISWISFVFGFAPWAYFFLVFHFQAYLRYLYPVMPLIFFGFLFSLLEIRNPVLKRLWTGGLISCFFVGFLLRGTTSFARDYELNKKWLGGNYQPLANSLCFERDVNSYMNERYGDNCTLVHINRPYNALLNCKYYANTWHSWVFSSRLALAKTEDEASKVLNEFGISHVTFYKNSPQNPVWTEAIIKKYLVYEYQIHDLILYKVRDK